jgi:hypothetical protein
MAGDLSARLSFGHGGSHGFLDWVFGGLIGSACRASWHRHVPGGAMSQPLRKLDHIASLHKSGALTGEE